MLGRFRSPSRHPRPSQRQSHSENFLPSALQPRRNRLPERFCCSPGRRPVVPAPQLCGEDARPRRPGLAFPRPRGVTLPGTWTPTSAARAPTCRGPPARGAGGPAKRRELAGRSAFAPAQVARRKLFQRPRPPEPGSVSPEATAFAAADALGPRAPGSAATAGAASGRPSGASSCPARAPAQLSRPSSAPGGSQRAPFARAARPAPRACPRLPAPRRRAGGGLTGGCVPLPAALVRARRRPVFSPPTEKSGKREGRW